MNTTIPVRTGVLATAAAVLVTTVLVIVLAASVAECDRFERGIRLPCPRRQRRPTGEVRLTGGGSFDASSGSIHAGGGFRCTASVNQGPLAGCLAGEGVRWRAAELLPSSPFKCTGAATEPLKTASTDRTTAVFRTDFFRAGDGRVASFTANVIVSANDIAPDIAGVQNVWVQGVGCATAIAEFTT